MKAASGVAFAVYYINSIVYGVYTLPALRGHRTQIPRPDGLSEVLVFSAFIKKISVLGKLGMSNAGISA